MLCRSCKSTNQRLFGSEISIHFPGLDGLNKPTVMVFPQLAVCLECGRAEFQMPESELCFLSLLGEARPLRTPQQRKQSL